MYCPKCGHQQVSEGVHYCSRCGFSLKGILTVRRKEMKQGAGLMLIAVLWFVFFRGFIDGWETARGEVESNNISLVIIVSVIPSIIFILGLARILYTVIEDRRGRLKHRAALAAQPPVDTKELGVAAGERSLPAFQGAEVGQPRGVSKLARPHSVTEDSTRLLRKPPGSELR